MAFIRVQGIDELNERLNEFDTHDMLSTVLNLMANQAKQRIEDGGPAPDGTRWPDWSPEYAKTRHGNQSLLKSSGRMQREIYGRVGADGLGYLGTPVIQGRRQQYGDKALGYEPINGGQIPARAFLGMSSEDFEEIREVLLQKLARQARGRP